jgi:hypothetical protein
MANKNPCRHKRDAPDALPLDVPDSEFTKFTYVNFNRMKGLMVIQIYHFSHQSRARQQAGASPCCPPH